MKVTERHLEEAARRGILSQAQAGELIAFLRGQPDIGPSFNFTHLLYYFGGLVAIGAMTLFMNLGWEEFGGWGIFSISLFYGAVGLYISKSFQKHAYAVPAGICATFVVALTPLAIYGLQVAMDWWPDDSAYRDYHRHARWLWIYMELGTLVVGIVMARTMKYPFMVMPVAVTLWYMSMDIALMLTGGEADWEFRAFFSMWFGLIMLLLAFWTELRTRQAGDYAFWLYLFGLMAFWGGLTSQHSDSELSKFFYFCINLFLIGCGAILVRRAFVVFGGLGCAGYFSHLASTVFADSWLFPFALTGIGLFIVYLGVAWQKHEAVFTARIHAVLPGLMRELLKDRIRA